MSKRIIDGWYLGKSGPKKYLCVNGGVFDWTDNLDAALYLARRKDAEALAEIIDDAWTVKSRPIFQ